MNRAAVVLRDWLHVGVRWPASVLDRTPEDAFASGDGAPVVLLPGIWESWRYLRPLAAALHSAGHQVLPVPGLGLNGGALEPAMRLVVELLRERDVRGGVLVAHSKGGLIGKHVLLDPDAAPRLAGMVAVCTPFGGSSLAWPVLARTPLGLFAPAGAVIMGLAAEIAVNSKVVSIGSAWDEMVPEGTALPGARNITLTQPGHFRPLVSPDVHALVQHHVARLAREAS